MKKTFEFPEVADTLAEAARDHQEPMRSVTPHPVTGEEEAIEIPDAQSLKEMLTAAAELFDEATARDPKREPRQPSPETLRWVLHSGFLDEVGRWLARAHLRKLGMNDAHDDEEVSGLELWASARNRP